MKIKYCCCLLVILLLSCSHNKTNVATDTIAEVNGEKILKSDIDNLIVQELYDELNRIYTIKEVALEEVVNNKLLEQEAIKHKLSKDEFLKKYTDSLILEVGFDSLVIKYNLEDEHTIFERNTISKVGSDTYEGKRIQKKKLTQHIKEEIIRSLKSNSDIKKYLYPPRNPNLNLNHLASSYRGNLNSDVTFLLISDFDCEKCIDYHEVYDRIYNLYKDKVKFGYASFSATPTTAIVAGEAMSKQNKFWEYYDKVYAETSIIDSSKVYSIAKEIGVDMKIFNQNMNSTVVLEEIENKFKTLYDSGVYATPSIVINDKLIFKSNSFEEITNLLDKELSR